MIRVDVVTHFNEDAFSHGLAQGMADRLRDSLRDASCPEHGGESVVRLSTEGIAQTPNDIRVEIEGCCAPVVERVQRVVEEIRRGSEADGLAGEGERGSF